MDKISLLVGHRHRLSCDRARPSFEARGEERNESLGKKGLIPVISWGCGWQHVGRYGPWATQTPSPEPVSPGMDEQTMEID